MTAKGNALIRLGKAAYARVKDNRHLGPLVYKVGWSIYASVSTTLKSGLSKIFLVLPHALGDSASREMDLYMLDLRKSMRIRLSAPDANILVNSIEEIFLSDQYRRNYRFSQGDVIVDAGANIGAYTVLAASNVGSTGRVVSIEPEKNNLNYLKRNIAMNGLGNVVVVKKGAWSKKRTLKLYLISDNIMAHTMIVKKSKRHVNVPVETIDAICRSNGLDHVDFIKMDIEGAEIEAVKGMHTLSKSKLRMAIAAYHPIGDGQKAYEKVIPYLRANGFTVNMDPKEYFVYAENTGIQIPAK